MSAAISVIIPTYDRSAFVAEAVHSVLCQSYADVEIIVVDDGSRDGTAAGLRRRFGARVRVIDTENRGVSAARNTGVAASRGDWIAFLDSDDLWRPSKLDAQVAHLAAHPDLAICHTAEIWIRNGVRVNPCRRHEQPEGDIFEPSLRLCLVSASSVLLRRDVFERAGGFDESLLVCEDYDLWLRLGRSRSFGLVREPLVVKRGGHGDQLSRRYWGMDRFRVLALRKLLAGPLTEAQRQATMAELERKCAILAAGAEKRGRRGDAAAFRAMAVAHA